MTPAPTMPSPAPSEPPDTAREPFLVENLATYADVIRGSHPALKPARVPS
jgi:hypothetical protein